MVARVSGGASVVRCLEGDAASSGARDNRVRVALGRNREARLPMERVLLATGLMASREEEVEAFRQKCEELASTMDLAEVWEVIRDEAQHFSPDDLAELYWGPSPDAAQRAACVLHLEWDSTYFVADKEGYAPRSRVAVEEIHERRRREAENAQAADSLVACLAQGTLPAELTRPQAALLEHLRGYVIHGEDYPRSAVARGLLERLNGGTRDLQRLGFELLVSAGVLSSDEPLELERASIPRQFSPEALAEAQAVDLAHLLAQPHRRDLSDIPTFTIDDADTQDRDDALSLEVLPGPAFRVGIHIADAGALVSHGGALDQEADRRMSTLYIPDGKVPMLPPSLSNQMGSLTPGEVRVALSLLVPMSEDGEVLGWEVVPSVVRSQAALSYEEADRALAEAGHPWHQALATLERMALGLRRRREAAGAVVLERPEMVLKALPSGEVEVRVLRRASPARQLVAEFMILCNALLAEFCARQDLPAAYRSQAVPDLSGIAQESAGTMVHEAALGETPLRWHLVMKRLPPASLDTVPQPHGGLGVPAYIQATSPLRRYPDLVMQRQISHFLGTSKPLYSFDAIASVAQRAEVQLRELARIEDERERYWFLKYLKQAYLGSPGGGGEMFQAMVLENVAGRTGLLELLDYPFRVRAELPGNHIPGEVVMLRLHGVDLWRRTAYFTYTRSGMQV